MLTRERMDRVRYCPSQIRHVPYHTVPYDMWMYVVLRSGTLLHHVKRCDRTLEMCMTSDLNAIQFTPTITYEAVINARIHAIGHVPTIPYDILVEAVQCGVHDPHTLELSMIAVSCNAYRIGHVPYDHRTVELCSALVGLDEYALQHIPEPVRDTLGVF